MGFLDALRRKPVEDEYYDEYEGYEEGYDSYDEDYEPLPREHRDEVGVQPIHSMADMDVYVSVPTEFKDGVEVADQIRQMKLVVLNMNKMDSKVSSRLLDFLSGVAYSEDATVQRIATNTYVVVPYFVDVMGSF